MVKMKFALLVLIVLSFSFSLVSSLAHAEEEVNLSELPQRLSEMLTIDLFAAQLLLSGLFLMWTIVPTLMLSKNIVAPLAIGFVVMSFCVAMTWLPYWILVVVAMIVALMFAGKMRDWITGWGRG